MRRFLPGVKLLKDIAIHKPSTSQNVMFLTFWEVQRRCRLTWLSNLPEKLVMATGSLEKGNIFV